MLKIQITKVFRVEDPPLHQVNIKVNIKSRIKITLLTFRLCFPTISNETNFLVIIAAVPVIEKHEYTDINNIHIPVLAISMRRLTNFMIQYILLEITKLVSIYVGFPFIPPMPDRN